MTNTIILVILILLFALTISVQLTYTAGIKPDNNGFNIAAVGDWACNENTQNTVNSIIVSKPELVLALGDLSYQRSPNCWFQLISPLDNVTTIVRGDHDNDARMNQYMQHFKISKDFYSFNRKNIHFLIMSTETPYEINSEQYQFVKSDLDDASTDFNIRWIIVSFHQPAYTSPTDCKGCSPRVTLREVYHPLFDKYGVDLVLQAHDHNYERSNPILFNSKDSNNPIIVDKSENNYDFTRDPHGTLFVTVGTGGGELNHFEGKAPFIVKQYSVFGFLNIDVMNNSKRLRCTFIANNGTSPDEFTVNK